jgi:hypothetical protein
MSLLSVLRGGEEVQESQRKDTMRRETQKRGKYRPRLSQKKSKLVNFKLTPEQYDSLNRVAKVLTGGNKSSLLRRWIIGAEKSLNA